ncbi:MAG: hypothetical protein ACLQOO_11350 [Terriglobia bacterium]
MLVIVTRNWSERAKNEAPVKPKRTFRLATLRLLPSVDCLLALPTVASFPILAKPDPLLSSKSVASFLKSSQLSAVSRQPSVFGFLPFALAFSSSSCQLPTLSAPPTVASFFKTLSAFSPQLPVFPS